MLFTWVCLGHGPLALDGRVVRKISKRHFFQDIKNSLHGVTQIGLKTNQNFFQNFFSTNMVARGFQSFCILEGATDPLIEQCTQGFLTTITQGKSPCMTLQIDVTIG